MIGKRDKIKNALWELFYDTEANEYTKTPYSRTFILRKIIKIDPEIEWPQIYLRIKAWQGDCNKYYNGIYNENKQLYEVSVSDKRKICEAKYQAFLIAFSKEGKIPLYFDKDIGEYRVAKSLQMYEDIMGEKIRATNQRRNDFLLDLAKRGGTLLSGIDSREAIFELFKESEKLERRRINGLEYKKHQDIQEQESPDLQEASKVILNLLKDHKRLLVLQLTELTKYDPKLIYDCIFANDNLNVNENEEVVFMED